jgi:hypothetical protein
VDTDTHSQTLVRTLRHKYVALETNTHLPDTNTSLWRRIRTLKHWYAPTGWHSHRCTRAHTYMHPQRPHSCRIIGKLLFFKNSARCKARSTDLCSPNRNYRAGTSKHVRRRRSTPPSVPREQNLQFGCSQSKILLETCIGSNKFAL